MKSGDEALSVFHPLVQRWFRDRVGNPTEIQDRAWKSIAADEHVLITAPTGSGKTLAAFLWALDRLISRAWTPGRTRVLYVSPLKALNNDIQRNLLAPLAELRSYFAREDEPFPAIRVLTRSGDTPESDRRQMLRRPPEILITTPESLNLILSSRKARDILSGVKSVILDEIHAVAHTKRGTHLITAVDRLVPLAGEFQRVALSATVKPLETVAEFVGGYALELFGGESQYSRRRVSIVRTSATKQYALTVRPIDPVAMQSSSMWQALAQECRAIVERNRSTLIFTNSRRLCERLCMFINEDAGRLIAYAHHGSLSRETRAVVEERLKSGELSAIVSTNSLELGIDIGALDEVVLIETPPAVSSAIQRMGRAGHRVGEVSRAQLFPTHGRDYVDAAVVARSVMERDVEEVRPVMAPLDVLAQVIVAMTGVETWGIDELYDFLRTSYPYRDLSRIHYDLVLEMLAGRYSESRLRALDSLISIDRIDGTVRGKDFALRLLYSSGGTIPDRGYFDLRRYDTKAKIGDLDEEFVWERALGDAFSFGTQSWQIRQVTHNDVLVEPARTPASFIPFWRAEEASRGFHLSDRLGRFLENANGRIADPAFREELVEAHCMEPRAADELLRVLGRQRATTQTDLPHRHHLLFEHFVQHLDGAGTPQIVIHTLWGGPLNKPFAMALAQAWEERHGERLEVQSDDESLMVSPTSDVSAAELLSLVEPEQLEELLRHKLETTGYFGARFRENAARALLLPRQGFNRRMPLWLNRQRSKRLMESVMKYPDFPILIETWRTCLQDEFDLDNLRRLLQEVKDGVIAVSEAATAVPSPFAQGMLWMMTNQLMYEDDTPASGRTSNLTGELLKEVMFSPDLRPRVPEGLAASFERKLQRVHPGYAPQSADDLLDWLKERLFVPVEEWQALLEARERELAREEEPELEPVAHKIARLHGGGGRTWGYAAVEVLPRLQSLFDVELYADDLNEEALPWETESRAEEDDDAALAAWLAEWLRYYGPVPRVFVATALPVAEARVAFAIDALVDAQDAVAGPLTDAADEEQVCDRENLEILLRMARAERRPTFEALPLEALPLFVANHQGVGATPSDSEGLQEALGRLFGYPAPVELLESDILPSRMEGYVTGLLDALAQDSGLVWFGCGERMVGLALESNLELFLDGEVNGAPPAFPSERGRYAFSDLLDYAGVTSSELTRVLWEAAWAGRVTNDSFAALRKGVEHKFKTLEASGRGAASRRAGFQRWKTTRPFAGNWYVLPKPESDADSLERDEANKDRVRVLLDRYGVLFREILQQELPALRWGALFRTLRLMELSGELVSGQFFEGVPGLQFASHEAVRDLQRPLPEERVYWMNADDPASLCGLDLPGLKSLLPRRLPTNHLVYRGAELVVVSKRLGKELEIRVPPEHPNLADYLGFLRVMLTRPVRPLSSITLETVNGEASPSTPYRGVLQEMFDVEVDSRRVTLWRKHGP